MFGKLNLENIANRITGAFDSLQGLVQARTSNFLTPSFNPANDQQAAINHLTNKFVEGQAEPQDKFAQQAKELIDKYTPKNVLLVGKFDSKGLGAELAALVPKGAKLGDAVFAELVPGDKADTARAMTDNLSDDTLKQMTKTTNGKALLERTVGLLDGKTTNMWDLGALASGDKDRQTRIENALGRPQVEQKSSGQVNQTPVKTASGELMPMYDRITGATELNKKLLETIGAVDPQPTGIRPTIKQAGGVTASESAASQHSKLMSNNDLKAKFERLGDKYNLPPALIAGIASRESNMGAALQKTGIFAGWGDKSQRPGETEKQFHGFGIIQVDKKTAPLGINKELEAAYGKTQLDPYSEEHIEWGVRSFLKKLEEAKANNPNLSEANQVATAVSKYNGGLKNAAYPRNDAGTSGKDYANDTLIRARWFAENWDKLK